MRITLFSRDLGTSLLIILCARPSIRAVFPTPGSPIKIGLFLVRRESTWMVLLISSSRPMTGSSSRFWAFWVTFMVNFSKALKLSSEFSLSDLLSFRILDMRVLISLIDKPVFFKSFAIWGSTSRQANRRESIDTNWSWLDDAFFSAFSKSCNSLGSAKIWPPLL